MTNRSQLRIGLAGVALVLLIATALYFALNNSPITEATPDSTTTTTIPPAPTSTTVELPFETKGPQLEWANTLDLSSRSVMGIHEFQGTVYVFASHEFGPGRDPQSTGMDAWVTTDGGQNWVHHQDLIDGNYQVDRVIASEHGLTAVGADPESLTVMAWHSTDAESWIGHQVAVVDDDRFERAYVSNAVATTGAFLMEVQWQSLDGGTGPSAVARALEGIYGDAFGAYDVWADRSRVTVMGPLNIPIAVPTLAELDLGPDDIPDQFGPVIVGGPSFFWHSEFYQSSNGIDWEEYFEYDFLPAAAHAFAGTDDRIWLVAVRPGGGVHFSATSDGSTWEEIAFADTHTWLPRPQAWQDRLVAHGSSEPHGSDIMISDDGVEWTPIDPGELFDIPESWTTHLVATGDRGLASIVRPHYTTHVEGEAEVEHSGYTIRVHRFYVEIIDSDGITVQEVTRRGDFNPDAMDVESNWITFKHSETGEELFTLSVDRLWEIDRMTQPQPADDYSILLFTPDGEEWTIQDFSDVIFNETQNRMLSVLGDLLVAVVDTADGEVKVWTAPIP